MLRLKLILIVTIALVALAFGVTQLADGLADHDESRLRDEVARAERAFSAARRNAELELFSLSTELSRSDIAAWLGVIQDHEDALMGIERAVYQAVPGSVSDESKAAQRARWVNDNHGPLFERLANEVADRLERFGGVAIWRDKPRLEVVAEARKMLVLCNAVGYTNCVFRFAHYPLRERALAMREANGRRHGGPDVAIVVNEDGIGIADADVSKWSDVKDYADKVPAVIEALATGAAVRDIGHLPNREGWYAMAVTPILEGASRRGAVLVATPLDSELMRRDKDFVGFDVGYVLGGQLALTTLDADSAHALATELGQAGALTDNALVVGEGFVTGFSPLMGNVSMRDARLVVTARVDQYHGPIDNLVAWTWALAVLFGVLAVMALGWVLHSFFMPLRKIDAGLHEIIQGNRAVVFPTGTPEPTWSTMGQALNAAHAVLAQREDVMPGDPADGWAKRMMDDKELDAPN